jgi:hypothetical protein
MLEMQGALKQAVKDYDLLLQELGNVRNDSRKKSGVIDVLQARLSKAGEEQQSQQCALLSFLPSLTLFLSISAREHLYAQAKGPSHCCMRFVARAQSVQERGKHPQEERHDLALRACLSKEQQQSQPRGFPFPSRVNHP